VKSLSSAAPPAIAKRLAANYRIQRASLVSIGTVSNGGVAVDFGLRLLGCTTPG
jgi:hypothetical protein